MCSDIIGAQMMGITVIHLQNEPLGLIRKRVYSKEERVGLNNNRNVNKDKDSSRLTFQVLVHLVRTPIYQTVTHFLIAQ